MENLITDPDAVRAVLSDGGYTMPPVPPSASGIGWLRANVARFCDGAAHARRRGYAVDLLGAIDPGDLERRAHDETARIVLDRSTVDVMPAVARAVPVRILTGALGVTGRDLVATVAAAARAYQPSGGLAVARPAQSRSWLVEADAAVATLVEVFGAVADEITAARIGLLVQACDATAGLIGNAVAAGSVAAGLRHEPPVRRTRRVRGGSTVHLDLTAEPFGAGPHRCPGDGHATAIAAGAVAALRGWRPVPGGIEHEPNPALRIPARLLVTRGP